VRELLTLIMEVIQTDNEDSSLMCLRIIFDLHKNYRPALESEVQPFLDLVHRIYLELPSSVSAVFSPPLGRAALTTPLPAPMQPQVQSQAQIQAQTQANAQAGAQVHAQAQAQVQGQMQVQPQAAAALPDDQSHAQPQQAIPASAQVAPAAPGAAVTAPVPASVAIAAPPAQTATVAAGTTADTVPQAGAGAGSVYPPVPAVAPALQPQVPGMAPSAPAVPSTASVALVSNTDPAPAPVPGVPALQQVAGTAPPHLSERTAPLLRSTESFKVLTECPLTVMLLFQLYPRHIQKNVPELIPLMIKALVLAPANKNSFSDALLIRYKELISCQVKTLSFLTYLLRGFADTMAKHEKTIAESVINLMRNCPPDAVATRKELLVATRHILVTDFRKGFFGEVDKLLDEEALLGTGRQARETLRPLAFSTLADLVHHVRASLTLDQVARVIEVFSRNIHDTSLPITIQTTSVRLLLNLVDYIFHNGDADASRGKALLIRILTALVHKFGALRDFIPLVEAAEAVRAAQKNMQEAGAVPLLALALESSPEEEVPPASAAPAPATAIGPPEGQHASAVAPITAKEVEASALKTLRLPTGAALGPADPPNMPRKYALGGPPSVGDSVKDVKSLVKTMIVGLKTVIWCCSNYRRKQAKGQAGSAPRAPPYIMTPEELSLVAKFMKWGLPCLGIFTRTADANSSEWKDVLDHFAGAFTVLESYNLRASIGRHIPELYDAVQANPALLTVPQHLLANSNASSTMADVLLYFLVHQMDELAGYDPCWARHVGLKQRLTSGATRPKRVKLVGPHAWEYEGEMLSSPSPQLRQPGSMKEKDAETDLQAGTEVEPAVDAGAEVVESEQAAVKIANLRATVLLRLFKVVFGSVALFAKSEVVLRPHLQTLILSCLRYTSRVSNPTNYYHLLRTLFRSISGGKFELSYKEILPLLPLLLTELGKLHERAEDPVIRNLLVELCLTVPARLASLLPHLPLMMRLMVHALTCRGDLEGLALRTLEFWVDNLNPDYLYKVMSHDSKVLTDIMCALCDNLRPTPFPYGTIALRLLGKLGGRSRRFISEPMSIPVAEACTWDTPNCFNLDLEWGTVPEQSVPLDGVLRSACRLMESVVQPIRAREVQPLSSKNLLRINTTDDGPSETTKKQAASLEASLATHRQVTFRFLLHCLSSVAGLDSVAVSIAELRAAELRLVNEDGNGEALARDPASFKDCALPQGIRFKAREEYKAGAVTDLLRSIMVAATAQDLAGEAMSVLQGLIMNMMRITTPAEIESGGYGDYEGFVSLRDEVPLGGSFSPLAAVQEHLRFTRTITPDELSEAILGALHHRSEAVNGVASECIRFMVKSSGACGGEGRSGTGCFGRVVLQSLLDALCRVCFEKDWRMKLSACNGIRFVCELMSRQATELFECKMLQAIIFTVKDHPREISMIVMDHAYRALEALMLTRYGVPLVRTSDEGGTKCETVPVASAVADAMHIDEVDATPAVMPVVPSPQIVHLLSAELSSSREVVGHIVHDTLRALACAACTTVTDVLAPCTESIRKELFAKPLRSIQASQQIGLLELMTYCVSLRPPLLTMDNKSVAFLEEILGMLDSADRSPAPLVDPPLLHPTFMDPAPGVIRNLPFSTRTQVRDFESSLEMPYTTRLRVNTIKLVHAAFMSSSEEFSDAGPRKDLKYRFMSLFFRSLTGKPVRIVEAATAALLDLIPTAGAGVNDRDQHVPKDLLQQCLRPVLKNLGSIQKLSKSLFDGLSRLLYLLASWFNVTLGDKLFEYLRQWVEPDVILHCGEPKGWKSGEEPDIAAGLMGLFHLLPHSSKFLEPLVSLTIQFEGVMHMYRGYSRPTSPYLQPLILYLNRYAKEALDYFISRGRLLSKNHSNLLVRILKVPEAAPLRDLLVQPLYTAALIRVCFGEVLTGARERAQQAAAPISEAITSVQSADKQVAQLNVEMESAFLIVTQAKTAAAAAAVAQPANGTPQDQQLEKTLEAAKAKLASLQESMVGVEATMTRVQDDLKSALGMGNQEAPPLPIKAFGSYSRQPPEVVEMQYQGLVILHALIEWVPTYLKDRKVMSEIIRHLWRYISRLPPDHRHGPRDGARATHEVKLLLHCLKSTFRCHPTETTVLFEMLTILTRPAPLDLTDLMDFCRYEVPELTDPEQKRAIFSYCLALMRNENCNEELKIQALKVLLIPSLCTSFSKAPAMAGEIIDNTLISAFMRDALGPATNARVIVTACTPATPEDIAFPEPLRIELLRLATLMIEFLSAGMVDHRKELIKFAWNHLKAEESMSKQWAYINVCRFISVFDTPPKIILQVYVALLRAHQPEVKDLVRTALDILVPALPRRLTLSDFIKAIKWTKKIMYEDGHALPQLIHMWQLVLRHPVLFYTYRSQFVPQMVNSLNRLGLPPNCPLENRQLASGLADLMISWEQHRRDRVAASKVAAAAAVLGNKRPAQHVQGDPVDSSLKVAKIDTAASPSTSVSVQAQPSAPVPASQGHPQTQTAQQAQVVSSGAHVSSGHEDEFTLTTTMVEMAVNFLLRMTLFAAGNKDAGVVLLTEQCLSLLERGLTLWPNVVSIKYAYFEKHLHGPVESGVQAGSTSPVKDPKLIALLETGLHTVILLMRGATSGFLIDNIGRIATLLPVWFASDSPGLRSQLDAFIERLLQMYPPNSPSLPEAFTAFYAKLREVLEKRLQYASQVPPVKEGKSAAAAGGGASSVSTDSPAALSWPAVRCIERICEIQPGYLPFHSSSLLKLLQRLARDHVSSVMHLAKNQLGHVPHGLADPAEVAAVSRIMPTPTMSLLQAAAAGLDSLEKAVEISTSPAHGVVDSLCALLGLVGRAFIQPGLPGDAKPAIEATLQVVTALLEKSTCTAILIVAVDMVVKWLPDPTLPLTDRDRVSLLSKMSRFDRLPEVQAIPLHKRYLNVLYDLCMDIRGGPASGAVSLMAASGRGWIAPHAHSIFTTGMLSTDLDMRAKFLATFMAGAEMGKVSSQLHHALQQDWSALANRFWPVALNEVLLKCLTDARVEASSHLSVMPQNADDAGRLYVTSEEKDTMDACRSALAGKAGGQAVASLLEQLSHADMFLADQVLCLLLPRAWAVCSEQEQSSCLSSFASLLSQQSAQRQTLHLPPSHASQHLHYVNSNQSILKAISSFRPLPVLPPDLLGWLAEQYNAWHEVLPIMEHQFINSSKINRPEWMKALSRLYSRLSEADLSSAVLRRFALKPETRVALSYETHGMVTVAQQKYWECMAQETSNEQANLQNPVSALELVSWEERWIGCATQLCQWNVLGDFSSSLQYPDLLMESSWKSQDWDMVRQCMATPTVAAAKESGSPDFKLYDIYLTIVDGKLQDVEKLCTRCVQLALHRWQLLPRIHSGGCEHAHLLHLFHQLVELRESGQIMVEVNHNASQRTLPDFKAILGTWRERLPNRWDSLRVWDDIFCWRTEVFKTITSNFNYSDPGSLACLHDTPWTVIKLAHTARKQSLHEVCLNSLSKLYTVATMDVQDAFEKLREQIIICYASPSEHRGGLNIINNTNLDYFNPQQKAELFRLKGMFLSQLGAKQDANHAYSHAMQICGDYGKGWLSWAKYCDAIFAEQIKVHCAAQAMACYLQAVNNSCASARLMMARVLWLLTMDDEKGTLGRTLENYGKTLPEWLWVPWIPQLLTALTRPEAKHVKALMKPVAVKYPQALYYTMRAFLLERRELPQTAPPPQASAPTPVQGEVTTQATTVVVPSGATVPVPAGTPLSQVMALQSGAISALPPPTTQATPALVPPTAAHHTEEIMSIMRRTNPALATEMESILEEMILHFRPEPAEELLSAVHALLIKCFQLVYVGMDEGMPASLKSTLQRVCNKFFDPSQHGGKEPHRTFADRFKGPFERDFHIGEGVAGDKGMTLTEVVLALKKWKQLLQMVVLKMPDERPLRAFSPFLAQVHSELETWNSCNQACIEIPGQYSKIFSEPRPELHAKLLRFGSQVTTRQRHGTSQRRLTMIGSNGQAYHFNVMFAIPHATRTDERMMQLHTMVQQLLSKHVQAQRRNLSVQVPTVVPITPRMRLIEDNPAFTSLGEVYESDCHQNGKDPDAPVMKCREAISAAVQEAARAGADAATQASVEGVRAALLRFARPIRSCRSSDGQNLSSSDSKVQNVPGNLCLHGGQ
jgi:hypothetical protein